MRPKFLKAIHPGGFFYFRKKPMPNDQDTRVIELWRSVIDQAIKDEDYAALSAMPVDLFMMLGITDPYASQDEQEGHVLAEGCYRAEPHFYD